jgi:hypothetical protein
VGFFRWFFWGFLGGFFWVGFLMPTLNMSLFGHFFNGLSLYLEARIWIRIRIRIHIKVKKGGSAFNKNQNPDTDSYTPK